MMHPYQPPAGADMSDEPLPPKHAVYTQREIDTYTRRMWVMNHSIEQIADCLGLLPFEVQTNAQVLGLPVRNFDVTYKAPAVTPIQIAGEGSRFEADGAVAGIADPSRPAVAAIVVPRQP
jgi:hypothetical protein